MTNSNLKHAKKELLVFILLFSLIEGLLVFLALNSFISLFNFYIVSFVWIMLTVTVSSVVDKLGKRKQTPSQTKI